MLWLHAENFPINWNLVRLSCLPSKCALQWKAMYITAAHYRCLLQNCSLPNHVTYDCGINRKVNEKKDNIDFGTLQQIVMVKYRLLRPILMKVSLMKHGV